MSVIVPAIKIGNTKLLICDRSVLNSANLTAGTNYSISRAVLYWGRGTNALVNVSGMDKAGNTYGYKTTPEVDAGQEGYYVNGTKMATLGSGGKGNQMVVMIRELNGDYRAITVDMAEANMGMYVDGDHEGFRGVHYAYSTDISGWGKTVKANFLTSDPRTIQFRVNNQSDSTTRYCFEIGVVWTAQTPPLTLDTVIPDDANPYDDAGHTGKGGGDPIKQNFGDDSDFIVPDAMPTIGAVGSGLITVFNPTIGQVQRLAEVLWGADFFDWVNKIGSNIDDLFITFGMLPFVVTPGNTINVTYWGFLNLQSHIPMRLCGSQYEEFDMGSIDLGNDGRIHTTDSVFDYSPYSKLAIYLPFIGTEELDIDECRGAVLNLVYRIDVLSGSCLAIIWVNGRPLYQFAGNCMTQLPLTSVDASAMITNSVQIGAAIASAGTSQAVAGAGAAAVEEAMTKKEHPMSQLAGEARIAGYQAQVSNATGNLASASANASMGMKPNFKHTGALGASTSMFAIKQPYLILTTPNEAVPEFYEKYCGLPSNITKRLGDLSGFTVVEDIRLNGLVATSPEVDEIYKLLKSGVII